MRSQNVHLLLALVVSTSVACDGGTSRPDGSVPDAALDGSADAFVDSNAPDDAADPVDAADPPDAMGDAGLDDGAMDATADAAADATADATMDAASMDASLDAAAGCHAHPFGASEVSIETAAGTAPAATGGAIQLGSYDLVRAQNFGGSSTGLMRSTWVLEDATTLQELTAINLSGGALPMATPRTRSWETSAARLLTTRTCEGTDSLSNDYSIETAEGRPMLVVHVDLGSGSTLLLSYRRR